MPIFVPKSRGAGATAAAPADTSPAQARIGGVAGQAVAGAVIAVLFMGSTLLTPLYGLYSHHFGFSKLVLVLLYAVYVIGNLTALLVFGRLSDQIGRRPVVLGGLGLAMVSAGLFLGGFTPTWLFAARILSGLAVGIGAGAATAWIAELTPEPVRARAAFMTTIANFIGLALGPLAAGPLVQYAPAPLRLAFGVYLGLLALVALAVVATRETVTARAPAISIKPRLGVPAEIRVPFVVPAVTLFTTMALIGFYAALGPTTMREDLHVANLAVSGAAVAELFVVAAIVIAATTRLEARPAMLSGLVVMPLGVALLVAAQRTGSLPLLLVATAVCGVAGALGYRGSLQVINRLAPPDRRAEVVSAYFLCGFMGNALPVIGVGLMSQALSARTADLIFAAGIVILALGALALGLRARPART